MNPVSHKMRPQVIPQIADVIARMPCACKSGHDETAANCKSDRKNSVRSRKATAMTSANRLSNRDAFHGLAIATVMMPCAQKSEHDEPAVNRESDREGFAKLAKATAIILHGSRKRPHASCKLAQKQVLCISQTRESESDEARELAKKRQRCFGFCQSRKAIAVNCPQRRKLKRAPAKHHSVLQLRSRCNLQPCKRAGARHLANSQERVR